MVSHATSSVSERLDLVARKRAGATLAQASRELGYSPAWGRKWWRRYQHGGEAALAAAAPGGAGPLATFEPLVRDAIVTYRQTHPLVGARRAATMLGDDAALDGLVLPAQRTIHRAWVARGLVPKRLPRDAPARPRPPVLPPDDPHAVWEIDHQDHLRLNGIRDLVVLQAIRVPDAGFIVEADLFPGPHGAHAVPTDDVLDGLRRAFVRHGPRG